LCGKLFDRLLARRLVYGHRPSQDKKGH
jgi:hypothetical protein